jgi:hypothetical protein
MAKLREEQDKIWGPYAGETCDQFHIDVNNVLKQVPLMDRCVLETERVFPPAPGNFRGAKEDFEYEGVSIKAGSSIFYDAIATNHEYQLNPNPNPNPTLIPNPSPHPHPKPLRVRKQRARMGTLTLGRRRYFTKTPF